MRILIVLLALLLLPVFVIGHSWVFKTRIEPRLAGRAHKSLVRAGVKQASVSMIYMDATIEGVVSDLDARAAAAAAVEGIEGVRVSQGGNLIVVPARVDAEVIGNTQLTLSGWLPDERTMNELVKLITNYRPDIVVETKKLRVSPFVRTGEKSNVALTSRHRLVKPVLDMIKVLPSLVIEKSGEGYIVRGYLPSETLRDGVIDALQSNPAGLPIDFTKLVVTTYVDSATFTKTNALVAFLKSYFQAPVPGTFSVEGDASPQLAADATLEMEAAWLSLLRGVSGSARIDARLTIHPSVYHLPGRKLESVVTEGWLTPLLSAVDKTQIFFGADTASLESQEEMKLACIAPTIIASGPEARVLVGSFTDVLAGKSPMARARAEAVKDRLVALGVDAEQIEVVAYGPAPVESADAEEQKHIACRVEMLVR